MAASLNLLPIFLLPFLTMSTTSDVLSDLTSLQSTSPSGVIHLTDTLMNRILALPTPRPFHFLIFFDAQQLHSKPELSLPSLKSQFSLLSKSHLINSPPSPHSPLLFFTLEFKHSQNIFSLFGVNSLPHIKLIPPHVPKKDLEKDSIKMEPADFSGGADSMSGFIESKAGISIGIIHRDPLFSKKQMGIGFVVMLLLTPFLVRSFLRGDTLLHSKGFWLTGAVFVYFFSVSGAMHNIIRKMPMFLTDRNDPDKLVFFYQGSGMQLGAEGFFVGFLYTVVGLLLALTTHVLVRVRSVAVQRFVMIVALFVSFWAVGKVVSLDNWKTGYAIHAYWPTSWR
ncbi:hypothetical protein Leryth_024421 [Lithospermum erythrorhizon]|nr:hypothetical protein Leryth_024421 [Lithospermum erythrorhizon]